MKECKTIALFYLLFFLLSYGCAQKSQKANSLDLSMGQGVMLELNENDKLIPHIPNQSENEETLKLLPSIDEITPITKADQKGMDPVVGLILGPGINRALTHISFLKVANEERFKVHIITGNGLGSIIATLFAFGVTTDAIEWRFHKFFSMTKGLRPYSGKWLEMALSILMDGYQNKKIQNSKIKLILPIIQHSHLKYIGRGDLLSILRQGLSFSENNIVPFSKSIFNQRLLIKSGADFVIGLDVLAENIIFDRPYDFLFGTFSEALGHVTLEKNQLNYFLSLPVGKMALDSNHELASYMMKSYRVSKKSILAVKQSINDWKIDH